MTPPTHPEPGPEPPVSDEERDGVPGTEMNPEPALGVGKSSGGRAEDLVPDQPDTATRGPAGPSVPPPARTPPTLQAVA